MSENQTQYFTCVLRIISTHLKIPHVGIRNSRSRELRNLVIDMVLATDMSYHFQQLKQVKTMIGMPDR